MPDRQNDVRKEIAQSCSRVVRLHTQYLSNLRSALAVKKARKSYETFDMLHQAEQRMARHHYRFQMLWISVNRNDIPDSAMKDQWAYVSQELDTLEEATRSSFIQIHQFNEKIKDGKDEKDNVEVQEFLKKEIPEDQLARISIDADLRSIVRLIKDLKKDLDKSSLIEELPDEFIDNELSFDDIFRSLEREETKAPDKLIISILKDQSYGKVDDEFLETIETSTDRIKDYTFGVGKALQIVMIALAQIKYDQDKLFHLKSQTRLILPLCMNLSRTVGGFRSYDRDFDKTDKFIEHKLRPYLFDMQSYLPLIEMTILYLRGLHTVELHLEEDKEKDGSAALTRMAFGKSDLVHSEVIFQVLVLNFANHWIKLREEIQKLILYCHDLTFDQPEQIDQFFDFLGSEWVDRGKNSPLSREYWRSL